MFFSKSSLHRTLMFRSKYDQTLLFILIQCIWEGVQKNLPYYSYALKPTLKNVLRYFLCILRESCTILMFISYHIHSTVWDCIFSVALTNSFSLFLFFSLLFFSFSLFHFFSLTLFLFFLFLLLFFIFTTLP